MLVWPLVIATYITVAICFNALSPRSLHRPSALYSDDDTWYSIFPVENEDLVYSRWEDKIIWDPDNIKNVPEPPILTLDPNDENIILGIPEDVDPSTLNQGNFEISVCRYFN